MLRRPLAPGRVLAHLLVLGLLSAGCGADPLDTAPVDTGASATTAAPAGTEPAATPATTTEPAPVDTEPAPTSTERVTTTTEPDVELPTDGVFAVPTQNREDPAKNQFQVQLHNTTRQRFDVTGIQFAWDGITTVMVDKTAAIVGGQIVDLPVPFPGAVCSHDVDVEPRQVVLSGAVARVRLATGEVLEVPVVDQWHTARKLYLDDCARQWIDAQVEIVWEDLREAEVDGRPVTVGRLALRRREAAGEVVVHDVGNTIPFVVDMVDAPADGPALVLAASDDEAFAEVHFLENRCDPHALAEVKQPTKFIAQLEFADGTVRPYVLYPERADWIPMQLTANAGCVALGKVE